MFVLELNLIIEDDVEDYIDDEILIQLLEASIDTLIESDASS
jgi:hypothetical protein